MRTLLAFGMVAAAFGFASADDKKDPTAGKWLVESVTRDGTANTGLKGAIRVHANGKYANMPPKGTTAVATGGTYTLDTTKSPITIDVTPKSGPNEGKTLLGIVHVESNTLTIAYAEPGKERPTKFDAKGAVIVVCKRTK